VSKRGVEAGQRSRLRKPSERLDRVERCAGAPSWVTEPTTINPGCRARRPAMDVTIGQLEGVQPHDRYARGSGRAYPAVAQSSARESTLPGRALDGPQAKRLGSCVERAFERCCGSCRRGLRRKTSSRPGPWFVAEMALLWVTPAAKDQRCDGVRGGR